MFYVGVSAALRPLPPEERDPPPLSEHGVRLFGTLQRESWDGCAS